jgi:N-acetylglucosamine-6-sulfatase
MERASIAIGSGVRNLVQWGVVGALIASIVLLAPARHARAVGSSVTEADSGKPNIVLILTDDQRWDTLRWMPNVRRLLMDKGVTFTNAFVPNSLCCPSRVTILTGQYSHTNGIWSNEWPNGGFKVFRGHDGSTIATWLHDAGYRTALIGKYLNEYKDGIAG